MYKVDRMVRGTGELKEKETDNKDYGPAVNVLGSA